MRNRLLFLSLILLGFLPAIAHADRPSFTWQPGTISASIKFDKYRPAMGSYLYIKHDSEGNADWNMAKLNLPETWTITSLTVEGLVIRLVTEHAGEFTLTPQNLKPFWSALIKARTPSDAELEAIWRHYAQSR